MTTLLAIDPCAERPVSNTGWAFGSFSDTEPFLLLNSGIVEGGFNGLCKALRWEDDEVDPSLLRDTLVYDADVVVVEHYVAYNKAGDISPVLAEGVVRYFRLDAVLQPSNALSYVSDGMLKALGLYSTQGHHKDRNAAVKHALAYLRNIGHRPTLKMLTGRGEAVE